LQSQANFIKRNHCISCSSADLQELSQGRYTDEPLRSFLAADPWGVDPLTFLREAKWSFVECKQCSQAFHRLILDSKWNERRFSEWMTSEAIHEFENRIGSNLPANRFNRAKQHTKHILRIEGLTGLLRQNEPVRLLDFGCGWGEFLQSCQHFGFDAIGVDRSTARRLRSTVRIESTLEDVEGPFHAVTLFESLEHLDEPLAVLKSINPLVHPGGILVLETPDCTGVTNITTHRDYLLVHPLEHINAFTHTSLKSIARNCGFEHISRPIAYVTGDLGRVARDFVKGLIGKGEQSTQLYFRKVR
jgi:2-polyprenyl-3-methyl-5-hydroxy-6-metoxy-1,4-benzoquinol methylase